MRWWARGRRGGDWTRSRSPARSRPAAPSRRRPLGASSRSGLELGGQSPFIVFPDADLDEAAAAMGVWGAKARSARRRRGPSSTRTIHHDLVDRIVALTRNPRPGPSFKRRVDRMRVLSPAESWQRAAAQRARTVGGGAGDQRHRAWAAQLELITARTHRRSTPRGRRTARRLSRFEAAVQHRFHWRGRRAVPVHRHSRGQRRGGGRPPAAARLEHAISRHPDIDELVAIGPEKEGSASTNR